MHWSTRQLRPLEVGAVQVDPRQIEVVHPAPFSEDALLGHRSSSPSARPRLALTQLIAEPAKRE
jgi:hypothetical protein